MSNWIQLTSLLPRYLSDSMLRDSRMAELRQTLRFFAKISFRTLAFVIALFQS